MMCSESTMRILLDKIKNRDNPIIFLSEKAFTGSWK